MISKHVDINSPLADIAKDIAEKYLLRPFPTKVLSNKLLDYTEIRKAPLNKKWVNRIIHGYQNASRVAALIPVILDFYKKHIHEFPFFLQEEIKLISPEKLKKIQIVGLMRATGRTEDGESGSKFSEQGKLECLQYLQDLGLSDANEREELATAIIDSEGGKSPDKMSLGSYLLNDATVIETFRDGTEYEKKLVPIEAFGFYRGLQYHAAGLYHNHNAINHETLNEFLDLCCMGLEIVKTHQGFLTSALQDGRGNPIVEYWPKLTYQTYKKEHFKELITRQMKVEYDEDCFGLCERAIRQGANQLNQAPYSFEQLIQDFYQELKVLDINLEPASNNERYKLTEYFFQFFEPKLGRRVEHTHNNQQHQFRVNWDSLYYYFVIDKKILKPEYLMPSNIFKESIIVKENKESYNLIFHSEEIASHYLILLKLFLHREHFFELSKGYVTKEENTYGPYFQFKISDTQFTSLVNALKQIPSKVIETNISNLFDSFRIAIVKDNNQALNELFVAHPILNHFPFKKIIPLHTAIENNNLNLVKAIIEDCKNDINIIINKKRAIAIAIEKENNEMIKCLLETRNIDFNEEQTKSIREIFRKQSRQLTPRDYFCIKTIRTDELCYVYDFFLEIIDPTNFRYPKRDEPKKHLSVHGNTIYSRTPVYDKDYPTKQKQHSKETKEKYTKAQSMTLCLPAHNFYPKAFSFNSDKSLGVMIFRSNLLLNPKLMLVTAGGTKLRPWHHYTKESAQKYLLNQKGLLFSSDQTQFDEFIKAIIDKNDGNINEIIVRAGLNTLDEFIFFINSDNLPSRLLAKQFAMTFLRQLIKANKCPNEQKFQIVYYPPDKSTFKFTEYSDDEYLLDCQVARKIFLHVPTRDAAIANKNFEFLLALDREEVIWAFSEIMADKLPLAIHLLKIGYIHIFRFLCENANLSLTEVLDQHISKTATNPNINLRFTILYNALKSNDQELAEYIFDKINFNLINHKVSISSSPLLIAAEKGSLSWVKRFVTYRCFDPEVKNSSGYTALNCAALYGYTEIFSLLLQYGACPETTNSDGNTPLILAAKHGYIEIASMLLDKNVNVAVRNTKDKYSALDFAIMNMHESVARELVNYLLNNNIDILLQQVNTLTSNERLLMHIFSCALNQSPVNIELIKFCLKKNIVNYCDIDGRTPLHHIIIKICSLKRNTPNLNYFATLALILDENIDIHVKTKNNESIFDFYKASITSLTHNHNLHELRRILAEHALTHLDIEAITLLQNTGYECNIDMVDANGQTRLYRALLNKPINEKEIQFLIKLKSNPNCLAKCGLTPLHLAAQHLTSETFIQLLQRCENVNAQTTGYRWTPLHYAVFHHNYVAIDKLLDSGADLLIENANGETTLDFILNHHNPDVLKFFAKKCKETPIILMRFLYICDSKNIRLPSELIIELVGNTETNLAMKIITNCIHQHQSESPAKKEEAWEILSFINNHERKSENHNSTNRSNLSTYFRTSPKDAWTLRERHRGDKGNPLSIACEYYEKCLLEKVVAQNNIKLSYK